MKGIILAGGIRHKALPVNYGNIQTAVADL